MRAALIHFIPHVSNKNYIAFNHGLASISACIKRDGRETRLFIVSDLNSKTIAEINGYAPDIVFVYLATNQYKLFADYCEIVFARIDAPVFVGGPHATACPEDTIEHSGVDGVCEGEGESAAQKIVEQIESGQPFEGIDNLWTKQNNEVIQPKTFSRIADLDTLPFPDRSIFPYESFTNTRSMDILGFEFFFSRGCDYSCSFCANSRKRALNDNCAAVRRRSPSSVVDEIADVAARYGHHGVIGIQDDVFSSSRDWLMEFAKEYRTRVGLPFWCNCHTNQLGEDRIKALRHAGCFRVQVGIECGDEELRSKTLGKKVSNRRIIEAAAVLRKHHIKLVAYVMIGLPDEREEQILESVELCKKIAPDWILVSTFYPYPGTRIYSDLVAAGRIDPLFYKNLTADTYYSPTSVYDQRGVTNEKLAYYYDNFIDLVSGLR